MGRWSQARQRGGGRPFLALPPLLQMVAAVQPSSDEADVSYTGTVSAANFTPSDFFKQVPSIKGISVSNTFANTLRVKFSSPGAITTVNYKGLAAGMKTPDSVAVSP